MASPVRAVQGRHGFATRCHTRDRRLTICRTRQPCACDDDPPPVTSRADSQELRMSQIEYKTVLLPYKTGIFQSDSVEVAEMLNKEGVERWALSQVILPSTVWGRANTMVAIL